MKAECRASAQAKLLLHLSFAENRKMDNYNFCAVYAFSAFNLRRQDIGRKTLVLFGVIVPIYFI